MAIEIDPSRSRWPSRCRQRQPAFNADPLVWVLTGGEDHAVAATFPAGADLPEGFTAIGAVAEVADVELLEAPGVTVGGRVPRGSGGHDHFAG